MIRIMVFYFGILGYMEGIKNTRQRNPEDREKMTERLVRFLSITKLEILDGMKVEEVFKDQESTKDFLLSLSPEKYNELLVGINALVRNMDTSEVWHMDGDGVRMGDIDMFPEQADKVGLLRESIEIAQSMLNEGRSIEDVAILLTVSLTGIHPFVDGNGRTARFILALLLKGYNPQLIGEVLTSDDISGLVSGNHLEGVALNVIEQDFAMSEKYPTFDEHFFHSKEYNAKRVRVIMDMVKNDQFDGYRGWLGENTALEDYKLKIKEWGNSDLIKKIFE
jgi:Fic/DOC family